MIDLEKLSTLTREKCETNKQNIPKVEKVDISQYLKPTPKNKFNEFLKNALILIILGIVLLIATMSNDNSIARYEGPSRGLHR